MDPKLVQLERRLADLERTQKQLLMPKSKPRVIIPQTEVLLIPPLIQVSLTSNSHDWTSGDLARGFTVDRVTPITFTSPIPIGEFPVGTSLGTITIENPDNFNWLSGDKAICRKHDEETYYVIKVLRATCTRIRFKLTANTPNGLTPNLTAVAIAPVNGESGQPPSGSMTIKDIYGVAYNGRTDHKGVAEYDYNNDWWYATHCQHLAWDFHGTVVSPGVSPGDTNIVVAPVTAMDGILPSGNQTVRNTYNWDKGETSHIIGCRWSPVNGRYESYQIRYECE
jgi:hypothetical protein